MHAKLLPAAIETQVWPTFYSTSTKHPPEHRDRTIGRRNIDAGVPPEADALRCPRWNGMQRIAAYTSEQQQLTVSENVQRRQRSSDSANNASFKRCGGCCIGRCGASDARMCRQMSYFVNVFSGGLPAIQLVQLHTQLLRLVNAGRPSYKFRWSNQTHTPTQRVYRDL